MCSTFGIRDFPIVNSVSVTRSLNASIYEEVPLDIQWGPKATAPSFIHDGNFANLGYIEYMGNDTSSTTLRLNGNTFDLISVQFCASQHKSLLPADKQSAVVAEIVMGFRTNSNILEKYVFLCVPVLIGATTTPSVYLTSLFNGVLDGKPTSLLTVLPPQDKHFIVYSTCLQQVKEQKTSQTQGRVVVFTEGLFLSEGMFKGISNKISTSQISDPYSLPAIQLPDGVMDKSEAYLFAIQSETDYKTLLRYSQYYPSGSPDGSGKRTDNLDSYKCVPLEPSKNVKDGKIIVDTDTGELLSQVINTEEPGKPSKSSITPALVEKILAVCIAVLLVAFVLSILAYIVTSFTTPNADTFFGILHKNKEVIGGTLFFSTVSGVVFFIIGFFLSSML